MCHYVQFISFEENKIKANFYSLNEFQLFYSLTHKTIEVMLLEE